MHYAFVARGYLSLVFRGLWLIIEKRVHYAFVARGYLSLVFRGLWLIIEMRVSISSSINRSRVGFPVLPGLYPVRRWSSGTSLSLFLNSYIYRNLRIESSTSRLRVYFLSTLGFGMKVNSLLSKRIVFSSRVKFERLLKNLLERFSALVPSLHALINLPKFLGA